MRLNIRLLSIFFSFFLVLTLNKHSVSSYDQECEYKYPASDLKTNAVNISVLKNDMRLYLHHSSPTVPADLAQAMVWKVSIEEEEEEKKLNFNLAKKAQQFHNISYHQLSQLVSSRVLSQLTLYKEIFYLLSCNPLYLALSVLRL